MFIRITFDQLARVFTQPAALGRAMKALRDGSWYQNNSFRHFTRR